MSILFKPNEQLSLVKHAGAAIKLIVSCAALAALIAPAWAQNITMASTTSTEQSGLFGALLPDFKKAKMIDYDYAKYGASAERKRLISKWEKDVNSLPR